MGYNILLYGATGYSGRLIAAEGEVMNMSGAQGGEKYRMILAARDLKNLREVSKKYSMPFRCFGLENRVQLKQHLEDIDVVINAAGPFAFTAERLAKAALEVGCHYVDINGELDVYRKLDDLARAAAQRKIAIVSGAGHIAASSDSLLDVALHELKTKKRVKDGEVLGAVRVALSSLGDFSRGSAQTIARSLREEVIVIRSKPVEGESAEKMMIWHEPFGKLERMFDFGQFPLGDGRPQATCQSIGSAVNLIDTLTARLTVSRHCLSSRTIESYLQMGAVGRVALQVGSTFASLSSLPLVRGMTKMALASIPDEPSAESLAQDRNAVVLEIEDAYCTRLIDWRWEIPNVYRHTARLVVAVSRGIARGDKIGWVTPSDALSLTLEDFEKAKPEGALRDTKLEKRVA
jgi:short subunit dehydrogenase-like uncharacterized protein